MPHIPLSKAVLKTLFVTLLLSGAAHASSRTAQVDDPSTDLGVTKTGPDQAPANSNVTYQIIVANNGPDSADNATMTDTLPSELTFVSLASPSGWTCTTPGVGSTGIITCTNPNLTITSGDVFTLITHTDSAVIAGSFITNKAAVSTTTPDNNEENNESAASIQIAGGRTTDAGVSIAVDKESALAGDNVTYTITLLNSDNADSVTLTDPIPTGMSFVSVSAPTGWSCAHPSPGSGGNVVCSIGTLAPTTGQIFTITAAIPPDAPSDTVFTNTATVTTTTTDTNSENNSASVATMVRANYVVSPTAGSGQSTPIKIAFPSQLQATVTLSNAPQTNVTVTFQAPGSGASGTFDNNSASATVTTDNNGVATSPTFTANGTAGGPYTVTASAGSGTIANFSLTNAKGSQTISFPTVPTQTYGNPPVNLSASASSNLPVSFTVLFGPGTLSGNSLTIDHAGLIGIRASQPGDTNYTAAPPIDQILIVSKAKPSVTVASSQTPSDFGQSVTFTATVTPAPNTTGPTGSIQFKDATSNIGVPISCISGGGVCTAEISTTTLGTGSHTISALYNGDQNFASVSGALTGGQVVKPLPALSINDVSQNEGNSGTTKFDFTVTLSAASSLTVKVNYATADGTATLSNKDYQQSAGLLTFNPGETSKTITVLVNGDLNREPDETFFVNLNIASNASVTRPSGLGTIVNDDTLDPPLLFLERSGPNPNQAAAVDSILFLRDPFSVKSAATWLDLGPDRNTRVMLFAANLTLSEEETASAVVVNLVGADGQNYDIPAEDVRLVPDMPFIQIIFRLPDTAAAGEALVTLKAHGQFSNSAVIRIK